MNLNKLTRIVIIFLLVALSSNSWGDKLPAQSRELVFVDTSAFSVGIDNDPLWGWNKDENINVVEFTTNTPQSYYPPAVINIRFHKNILAKQVELREVARSAIVKVEKNFGLKESVVGSMKKVTYRSLYGYEVSFRSKVGTEIQDIKLVIAKSPNGNIVSLMALTLPGKLPHIQPAVQRVWDNINFK